MDKKKQIEFLQNEIRTNSQLVKFVFDLFIGRGFEYLQVYPDQEEKDGILLYRQNTLEDEPLWTGCIARTGNVGGSAGAIQMNKTAQIIDAVDYLLNKDFIIDQSSKIKVDRILIISNGIIFKKFSN